MIDLNTELFLQLKKVYENIEIDTMEANGIMFDVNKEYAHHYFMPFFKLAL